MYFVSFISSSLLPNNNDDNDSNDDNDDNDDDDDELFSNKIFTVHRICFLFLFLY